MNKPSVKIGKASKILGVSVKTLRRWETTGKISSQRTAGGTRVYSLENLENVKNSSSTLNPLPSTSQNSTGVSRLKIGAAAKHLNVSIQTLRRWEKEGRISSQRSQGNTRLYSQDELQRVKFSPKPKVGQPTKYNTLSQTISSEPELKGISTEELLKRVEEGNSIEEVKEIKIPASPLHTPYPIHHTNSSPNSFFSSKLFTNFLIGTSGMAALVLVVTSFLTSLYLTSPKKTQEFLKGDNVASKALSPFNKLAQNTVGILSPQKAKELGFVDVDPPDKQLASNNTSSSVLATTASSQFLEINSDTQINGNLSVLNSINGVVMEGTPSANTLVLQSGNTVFSLSNSATLDQDLSTTSSPTFSSLSASSITLSSTTNQIISGNNQFSLPSSSDTLVGRNSTDTLKNKSISGSDNTLTNIPNSALVNSKITISPGTNLTGGGDAQLGGSVSISLKDSIVLPGTLAVTGATTLSNTLDVTGATTLSSTLSVTGASTLSSLTTTGTINTNTLTSTALTFSGNSPVISSANTQISLQGGVGIGYTASTTPTFPDLGLSVFGNVGIGTTSPSYKLHVVGDANFSSITVGSCNGCTSSGGTILASDGSYSTPSISFLSDQDTGLWRIGSNHIGLTTGGNPLSGITINSNGNVGIGTTDATQKLEVVGNANISGNVGVGSSLSVTSNASLGSLNVSGSSSLTDTGITGKLNVSGNTNIGSSLTVNSSTNLDSLSVTKSISSNTLGVSGNTELNTLNTSGNVGINSSLTVNSQGTFGSLIVNGLTFLNGGLNTNTITATNISASSLSTTGNVGVGGSITGYGNLSGLNVSGLTNLSNLNATSINSSSLNTTGNIGVGSSLTVSSASSLDSLQVTKSISGATLGISGTSELSGNVGVGSSLNVTSQGTFGSLLSNNGLVVSGSSFLQSLYATNISSSTLTTTGNVGVGSSLTTSSAAFLDSLQVTKGIYGNTLGISGTGYFSGNVGIGGSLTVQGLIVGSGGISSSGVSTTSFRLTTGAGSGYLLQSDSSGNGSWVSTIGASNITADSLDFTELKDNLSLDASTDIALGSFNLTTSGLGAVSFTNTGGFSVSSAATFSSTINTNTFNSTTLLFTGSGNVSIGASVASTNLNLNPGTNGLINFAGGASANGCTLDSTNGNFTCFGNIGLGSSGGASGFWGRSGTTLSPSFSGDSITTSGNISTSGSGTITSSGTLVAQNGLTQTTGAISLTSTSGSVGLTLGLTTSAFNIQGNVFNVDTFNSRVGIGTSTPGSSLQVNGNSSIGFGTAGISGPTNGLIVNGNVGVGTSNTNSFKLQVNGSIGPEISNTYDLGSSTNRFKSIYLSGDLNLSGGITGSNLSQGGVVYTGANGAITSTSSQFYFDSTNYRLGVGTSAPAQALQVNGRVDIGDNLIMRDAATNGSVNWTLSSNAGGTGRFSIVNSSSTALFTVESGGNIGIGIGTGAPAGRLQLVGSGASTTPTLMTQNSTKTNFGLAVLDNGNVGIGTTSPTNLLQVSGTSFPAIGLTNPGSTNWSFGLKTDASDRLIIGSSQTVGTNYVMTLYSASNGGNVGIGTTSPSQFLSVRKDQAAYTYVEVDNGGTVGSGSGAGFVLSENTAARAALRWERDNSGQLSIISGGNGPINFLTGSTFAGASSKVIIKTDGNLGIGTASPSQIFQVNANASTPFVVTSSGIVGIGTTNPGLSGQGGAGVMLDIVNTSQSVTGNPGNAALRIRGTADSASNAKYLNVGYDPTADLGYLQAVRAGSAWTNLIFQANGGNVGIGFTSPQALLDVNGSLRTGSSSKIILGSGLAAGESGLWMDYGGITNAARIQAESQGVSYRSLFLNPAGGNLGIGGTSSNNKLEVWGNTRITGNLTVDGTLSQNGNISTGGVFLASDGSASSPSHSFTNDTDSGLWRVGANLIALTTNGSAVNGLAVNANGNVGIGTTNPGYIFEALGNGRFVSNINNSGVQLDSTGSIASGPTINFGTASTPNTYMTLGAYNSINNLDTKSRNFNLFSSSVGSGSGFFFQASSGNIGIGTTSPGALFTVGPSSSLGQLTVNSTGAVTSAGGTGQVFFAGHQVGAGYAFGTSGIFQAITDNPTGSANTYYQGITNNATLFSVRADGQGYFAGNVGVGTSGPGQKLDVIGSTRIRDAGGNIGLITTVSDDGGNNTVNFKAERWGVTSWNWQSDSPSGAVTYLKLTGNYTNSITTALTLYRPTDSSPFVNLSTNGASWFMGGNVGIGTTGPSAKLQINAGTSSDALNINAGASSLNTITFSGSGDQTLRGPSSQWRWLNNAGDTNNFLFTDAGNFLAYRGNIGIGATTSSNKLDVWGNARITGTLTLDGAFSNNGNITAGGVFLASDGSASAPSHSFTNDTDTGLWRVGTNLVALTTAGSIQVDKTSINGLSVSSVGYIGIGTTSQDSPLHIISTTGRNSPLLHIQSNGTSGGGTGFDDGLLIEAAAFATRSSVLNVKTFDLSRLYVDGGLGFVGIGTSMPFGLFQVGSSATNPAFIVTAATGNVGVGFTSPETKFQVYSGTARFGQSTSNQIDITSGSNIKHHWTSDASTLNRFTLGSNVANDLSLSISSSFSDGGNLQLCTANAKCVTMFADSAGGFPIIAGGAYRTYIDSNGNLGIGTTAPNRQLQVLGSGQTTSALTDSGNTGGTLNISQNSGSTNSGGALLFSALNDSSTYTPQAAIKSLLLNGVGQGIGDLAFSMRASTSDTALTERMRLTFGGNLGIGFTSPADSLYVKMPSGGNQNGISILSAASSGSGSQPGIKFLNAGGGDMAGIWSSVNASGYLAFGVNNLTEKMRIDGNGSVNIGYAGAAASGKLSVSGNVGIGTSNPYQLLNLYGGNILIQEAGTQISGSFANGRIAIAHTSDITSYLNTSGFGANTHDIMLYSSADTSNALIIGQGAVGNRFAGMGYIQMSLAGPVGGTLALNPAGGNVGIGTSAPGSLFEISKLNAGAIGPQIILANDSGTAESKGAISLYGGSGHTERGRLTFNIKSGGAGELIWSNGSGAGLTDRFIIDGSGNVGIGQSAPSNKLSLYVGNASADMLKINYAPVTGSETVGIAFARDTGGDSSNVVSRVTAAFEPGGGGLAFFTGSTGSPSERMRIDKAGNVGIGTTSPVALLHIQGTGSVGNFVIKDTGNLSRFRIDGSYDLYMNNSSNVNNVLIQADGDSYFAAGNVGVGFSNPNTGGANVGLEVRQVTNTQNAAVVTHNNLLDQASLISYGSAYSGTIYGLNKVRLTEVRLDGSGGGLIDTGGSTANLYLTAAGTGTAPTMTLTSGGNIGIGTANPDTKLYVEGPAVTTYAGSSDSGITIGHDSSSADRYAILGFEAPGYTGQSVQSARIATKFTSSGSQIFFGTSNSYASGVTNTAMMIDHAGNVGIGTTAPAGALDVLGLNTQVSGSNQGGSILRALDGNSRAAFAAFGNIDGSGFTWNNNAAVKIRQQSGTGWSLETTGTVAVAGQLLTNGNVGIGTTNPLVRFDVRGGNLVLDGSTGTLFVASSGGSTTTGAYLGTTYVGTVNSASFTIRTGGSDRATFNTSGDLALTGDQLTSSSTNFNVRATGTNGNLYLKSNGSGAVFINNDTGSGGVQIGAGGNSQNLTVVGTGTTCTIGNGTGATNCTSDQRLKENIANLNQGLDAIMSLRPVNFTWKDPNKDQSTQIGFIAQEVQQIFPQFVHEVYDGYLGLDYAALVVPTIKAVQEQQVQIATNSAKLANFSIDSDGNLTGDKIKLDKLLLSDDLVVDSSQLGNTLLAYEFGSSQTVNSNNGTSYSNGSVNVLDSLKSLDQALVEVADQEATNSAAIAGVQSTVNSLQSSDESQNTALDDLRTRLEQLATSSATASSDNLTPPDTLIATGSASLAQLTVSEATVSAILTAYDLKVSNSLTSLGTTTLGTTSINGNLNIDGTTSFENGNELNTIGTLYLQKSALASGLDLFNGVVTVNSIGNIITQGKVTASEVKTNKLTISNTPIATGSATLGASIGTQTIPAGQTSVTISTNQITSGSKIFVTPNKPILISVTDKDTVAKTFTVELATPQTTSVTFDWWIVGSE